MGLWQYCVVRLKESDFGYSNGTLGANLDTGLTTQTFIRLYRFGLPVNHFVNLSRASVYAFFVACAFILINYDFPHDTTS